MTKMTYVDALNAVLTSCTLSDEVSEKLTALRDSIIKRNTSKGGEHKPTKTQRENVEVKERILECLTHTLQGLRAGEVASEVGISGQKASALLRQLIEAGQVVRVEGEKRITLFKLAE